MNIPQLREFAESNPDLVVTRESTRYPGLFVVKYHRRVFYKGLWTPELCELRGLVVDQDWNVVARPFTKVFNYGEQGTGDDWGEDTIVEAVVKVNGFMAAATLTEEHGLLISTTGSLDSDFVDIAAKHIKDLDFHPGYTYLFEICDESDPHIIEEEPGPYLIGMRDLEVMGAMVNEHELDTVAHRMGVKRPLHYSTRFGTVLESLKACHHEGYMVYSKKGALKLKSPYYLVNKLLARIRDTKLEAWMRSGEIKKIVDEEFYPLINYIQENQDYFVSLDEQQRLEFMKEFLTNG